MKKMTVLLSAITGLSLIQYVFMLLRDRGLGKEDDKSMLSESMTALAGGIIYGETVTVNYKGIGYSMVKKFNPYLMSFTGCLGGIACTSGNLLLVSNIFRKMPADIQSGIVAHEFGHMVCGHKPERKHQFSRMFGGSDAVALEYEADAAACEIVGRDLMMATLEYMLHERFINRREIMKRISHLKEVV